MRLQPYGKKVFLPEQYSKCEHNTLSALFQIQLFFIKNSPYYTRALCGAWQARLYTVKVDNLAWKRIWQVQRFEGNH